MSTTLNKKSHILISASIIAVAFFIGLSIFIFSDSALSALAQSPHDDIEFPIAELGGCENKEACHDYCDDLNHINECIDFAERNNLMEREEIELARKFARAGREGPGGCSSKDSCDDYCEDIGHINECLAFAEEHDILRGEELDEARKVAKALNEGAELPGGCRNKRECEAYCENPDNIEQCLAFAEKAGFLPPEELEQARKFTEFLKRGETPGGCRGERECKEYCHQEGHFEECGEFAIKAGFVSPEEAEIIRKTGGRGPGNCTSKDECDAYCKRPENSQSCFDFAREHGLINNEEFERAHEGMNRLKDALDGAPPEVMECLGGKIGADYLNGILSGQVVPSEDIAGSVEECFHKAFGARDEVPGHDGRDQGSEGGDNNLPFESFLSGAPPEVLECVKRRAGEDIEKAIRGERASENFKPIINLCFKEFAPPESEGSGFEGPGDSRGSEEHSDKRFEQLQNNERFHQERQDIIKEEVRRETENVVESILEGVPEGIRHCVKEKLGGGAVSPIQAQEIVAGCATQFSPKPSDFAPSDNGSVQPSDFHPGAVVWSQFF